MSYTYTEIILPEPEHFAHRPSAQQLAAVVDLLAARGWVHRAPEGGSYVSIAEAKAALQATDAGTVLA